MFKMFFQKSYYVALLGVLNTVSGAGLAAITTQLHYQPIVMGFGVLTLLNLIFGVNNFAFWLRSMKRAPASATAPPELGD